MAVNDPSEDVDFELRDMVGHLLRTSQQLHVALWGEEFERNLTSPQFAVLHALAHEGEMGQTSLRSRASLDRSTATGILQRLVAKRWITRTRDARDARRNFIQLTDAGRLVYDEAVGPANQVNGALLNGMDAADRSELVRLLNNLVAIHTQETAEPAS